MISALILAVHAVQVTSTCEQDNGSNSRIAEVWVVWLHQTKSALVSSLIVSGSVSRTLLQHVHVLSVPPTCYMQI